MSESLTPAEQRNVRLQAKVKRQAEQITRLEESRKGLRQLVGELQAKLALYADVPHPEICTICGHWRVAFDTEADESAFGEAIKDKYRTEGAAAERERYCAAVCSWCRRGSKAVYREGYGWRHMVCDIQIDGDPIPVVYCQAAAIRASAEEEAPDDRT